MQKCFDFFNTLFSDPSPNFIDLAEFIRIVFCSADGELFQGADHQQVPVFLLLCYVIERSIIHFMPGCDGLYQLRVFPIILLHERIEGIPFFTESLWLCQDYYMLEFRYDLQLLIEGHDLDEDAVNDYFLDNFKGDCLLAVGDEELIKIHYHTNEPWKVLEYCASLGEIFDIVVEDMDRQARGLKG